MFTLLSHGGGVGRVIFGILTEVQACNKGYQLFFLNKAIIREKLKKLFFFSRTFLEFRARVPIHVRARVTSARLIAWGEEERLLSRSSGLSLLAEN